MINASVTDNHHVAQPMQSQQQHKNNYTCKIMGALETGENAEFLQQVCFLLTGLG